ncbi:hypothetical protein BKI52_16820 [marine bacterium AO1-C]|nr:hypothetical protein BKI52_16820 [marine bacterium AO1-C]
MVTLIVKPNPVKKDLTRKISRIKALFLRKKIAQGIEVVEQLCREYFEVHVGVAQTFQSAFQAHCYEHTLGRINDYELEKGSYEIAWQVLDFVEKLGQYQHSSPYLTPIPPLEIDQAVLRKRDLLHIKALQKKGMPVIFLQGSSGMGKTTLCKLYLYTYIAEYAYVAWISSGAGLVDALVASFFDENNQQQYTKQYKSAKFERIVKFLEQLDGKKLLIVDGLDAYDAFDLTMFKTLHETANFDILVSTTKAYTGDKFQTIDVAFFDEEQSSELFFKEHLSAKEDQFLPKLLGLVGNQPLMSRLVARILRQYKQWNVEVLYKFMRHSPLANTNWQIAAHLLEERSQDDKALFTHVLTLLNISDLSEQEKWVLMQFVLLPPFEIAWTDLKMALKSLPGFNKILAGSRSVHSFSEALESLTKKGWLSRDKATYKFHGVLQEATHYFFRFEVEQRWDMLAQVAMNLQKNYFEQKRFSEAHQIDKYLKIVLIRYE